MPKKSTLDDFKKPQYKNQIYSELAWVATDLAGLETLPSKQLTDRWRAAESELREQAKGIVTISKHDRHRKQFEVKYLQSSETLQICEIVFKI